MSAILDTLAASRKLEESGMPEPQSDAVVEVVNDAMNDLVTKEYLTAELGRRFGKTDKCFTDMKSDIDKRFGKMDKRITKLESKVDTGFAGMREDMAKSHKSIVTSMLVVTLAIFATQLAMLGIMLGPLSGGGAESGAGVPPVEAVAPPEPETRQ